MNNTRDPKTRNCARSKARKLDHEFVNVIANKKTGKPIGTVIIIDLYTEANNMPLLRAVSFAAKATADITAHTRPSILINQL